MTDEEFDAFVATASEALSVKQTALERRYALGRRAQWDFDAVTGTLRFSDTSGTPQVEAKVTPIGSYSTTTQTFRWAWSNPSAPEPARAQAARLRELFDVTGIEVFREETFEADEQMAWELAAMAVAHLSAEGAYRGIARHLFLFLAIDEIHLLGKPN